MRIAIIGCGEVGGAYARALKDKAELALCDIVLDGRPGALSKELGLPLNPAPGGWLTACDVAIAAVPGAASPEAADAALPYLAPDALYIDVSTGAPDGLRASYESYLKSQRAFVDTAIMSSIVIHGGATPVLLAGPRAAGAKPVFEMMGAPVDILDGSTPGEAVALKLLRSVVVKGLECLSVECLTAAQHLGLRDRLFTVLGDLDRTPIAEFMSALVRSHLRHAERRRHEMEESAAQLRVLGFDAAITSSLGQRYAATLAGRECEPLPQDSDENLDAALAWLIRAGRKEG